jgi:chemotaxis protein MotA
MLAILGILVVFGAIVGGYLMEKGSIAVLLQPAELIIILGSSIGTVLISNPPHVLKKMLAGIVAAFGGSKFTRKTYTDALKMMYELFSRGRRDGLSAIESDIEEPAKSKTFAAYPAFLKDRHLCAFVCDSVRMATDGTLDAFDLDQIMESDMDVHHHNAILPVTSLTSMADSLPGLGIVAAVLGVVITMGALGGPVDEIGHKVAAALVGTFLGILLCYGLVGPLAAGMAKSADEEHAFYHVLRVCITSFVKGTPPILAVEAGRRSIPEHVRPSFKELEQVCRSKGRASMAA